MKNAAMAAAIMTIIMAFCYGIPFCRAWHIAAQYTILMIISPFLTVSVCACDNFWEGIMGNA